MASRGNLIIDQGSDYIQDIVVTDFSNNVINLTGYSGLAQIRKTYSSNTYKSFSVATTANGIIQISMNAANTESIVPGQYVWDCEIVDNSTEIVTRVIEGTAIVTPSVTR